MSAGKYRLNVAARNASVDTVKLLLEGGADPRKSIAAVHAIKRQDDNWKPVIQLLLGYGYDINAFNPCGYRGLRGIYPGSVLYAAAAQNFDHIIPFLLENGADPFEKSESGYTPAELALERECDGAASILLDTEKRRSHGHVMTAL